MLQQVSHQSAEFLPLPGESVEFSQHLRGVSREDGVRQREQLFLRRQAEHREHIAFIDVVTTKTDELIERRLCVAHAALRAAGDRVKRLLGGVHVFVPANVLEMFRDKVDRDAPQVVALAARHDRRQHLLRLGGGEHELHVLGRFLQRLEQRIERLLREHVHLVDDVDFKLRRGRRVHHRVTQFADFIDATIAGAIDLQHVHRPPPGDLLCLGVVIREIDLRAVGAVEALGKNPCERGFAGTPWPTKKIRVRDPVGADGVGQRLADVILTDNIAEPLRTVFASYDLVRHLRDPTSPPQN